MLVVLNNDGRRPLCDVALSACIDARQIDVRDCKGNDNSVWLTLIFWVMKRITLGLTKFACRYMPNHMVITLQSHVSIRLPNVDTVGFDQEYDHMRRY